MFKQKDFKLHICMCMTGGFIATYSLLRCSGSLAAAQTSNLIHAVESALNLDLKSFLLCIGGFLFYMAGVESYVLVARKTPWNPQKWELMTEAVILAFIGLVPAEADIHICLYPAFFIMAAQWSAFHGTEQYNSSTIFSSNNVKQFSLAIGEYMCEKNKKHAEKAKFFGLTLVYYHIGVAAAFVCCKNMNEAAIWCCFPFLFMAAWNVFGPLKLPTLTAKAVYRHRDA